MELNKYQTPIEELKYTHVDENTGEQTYFTWNTCPEEIKEEFNEAVSTIPFIQWLISPNRPLCKDLPRDENGRAIWKITEPPIIEDTDYFRQTAIHFQRTGRYTDLRPNPNPNSAYRKWIDQEADRIYNGMLRESDGAWIPGDMYWYLNYSPIILTVTGENENVGERDTDFPRFWEGILWRSIGWTDARRVGQNFAEIAKRGASKSYYTASKLSKIFIMGERKRTEEEIKAKKPQNAGGVVIAYDKQFLIKDGTLNKFEQMIDHCANNTQFPRKTLQRTLNEMSWEMGYIDLNTGAKSGTRNTVLGVAVKDDPDKVRGKRKNFICFEEFGKFPNLSDTYNISLKSVKEGNTWFGMIALIGCVCAGTKVYTKDGREINIEDLTQEDGILGFDLEKDNTSVEDITYMQEPVYKECVRITAANGITLDCSIDHPILTRVVHKPRKCSYKEGEVRDTIYEYKFIKAGELKPGNRRAVVLGKGEIGTFGDYNPEDPYLLGLLIGDGSYGFDKTPRLSNCDKNVLDYVRGKYEVKVEKSHKTKDGRDYEEIRIKNICPMLRKEGIFGQVKTQKRLPSKYMQMTRESSAKLLAGLFDTDGCVYKGGFITLVSSSKDMLLQVKTLLLKFGIYSTINETKARVKEGRKDKNNWFWLAICSASSIRKFRDNIPLLIDYKKETLDKIIHKPLRNRLENKDVALIKKVEYIGTQRVYNITANNTHTYLANGIITHNTGGEEGNDFSSAMDMIYHPTGFFMRAYPNVWDKSAQTRGVSIFFFPAYINRAGCYNKDGISDVTSALFSICCERWIAKYHNPDPMQLTRTKAEDPITIQDAIMRRDGTKFPVAQITERIQEIDLNPNLYDDMYVGKLVQKSNGEVIFEPTGDTPIRKFPTKDNKVAGAVEIKALPVRGANGKVMPNRYIAGLDPIDDDSSDTMSLVSIFILDLFTDEIVAEWTGRLDSADACYEVCRLLLIFYNAKVNYENNKKGFHAYMKMKHCLHYLEEEPEVIRAKSSTKVEKVGNKLYGTNATAGINEWGRDLIKDYMLKGITQVKNGQDEDEVTIPNVMTWWNRALLEEARQWNPDGNFDRISAMGMLMILREDRRAKFGNDFSGLKKVKQENTKAADPFFERNYNHGKLPVVAQQGFHLPSTYEKIQRQ